ncbi:MAG: hypothetical protein ACO1TE_29075 [Prosthecobacter sp.]
MKKEITVDYLEMYHDSFFAGEIEAMADRIQQLVSDFEAFPSDIKVSTPLWEEYIKIAGAHALSTLSDMPLAVHAKK